MFLQGRLAMPILGRCDWEHATLLSVQVSDVMSLHRWRMYAVYVIGVWLVSANRIRGLLADLLSKAGL
jgi:hypothetical protein